MQTIQEFSKKFSQSISVKIAIKSYHPLTCDVSFKTDQRMGQTNEENQLKES